MNKIDKNVEEKNKTNFNLQEQLNQITLIDAPETKAAKRILKYLSSKFILMIIILDF